MPTIDMVASASPKMVPSQRPPHPGESMPMFAWVSVALFFGSLTVFVAATVAAVGGYAPIWIAIPFNAAVVYGMFGAAHEALHNTVCSVRWVNTVVGRVAWIFVVPLLVPLFSLPAFTYIHMEHHRHTNDPDKDPDMFASHAPAWQLPFRWALIDVFYAVWYVRRLRERLHRSWRRPVAELTETAFVFAIGIAGISVAAVTGHFWTVAIVLLIPQRIGLMVIGWWFDWLPHHGLELTQRENRYRATRVRIGMEWLLSPVLLMQNYHLMHHLYPGLPSYRAPQIWRRNEEAFLRRNAAISTAFGRQLNCDEFRGLKQGSRESASTG